MQIWASGIPSMTTSLARIKVVVAATRCTFRDVVMISTWIVNAVVIRPSAPAVISATNATTIAASEPASDQ